MNGCTSYDNVFEISIHFKIHTAWRAIALGTNRVLSSGITLIELYFASAHSYTLSFIHITTFNYSQSDSHTPSLSTQTVLFVLWGHP